MQSLEQWRALSARLRGLVEAVQLDVQFRGTAGIASIGNLEYLRQQSRQIIGEVLRFGRTIQTEVHSLQLFVVIDLPALENSLAEHPNLTSEAKLQLLLEAAVKLRALDTAVTFALSDGQQHIRSVTERAFQHLRRSIAADPDVQSKWAAAYRSGEF